MNPMKTPSLLHSPFMGILCVLGSVCSLQFGAAYATTLFPHVGPFATTSLRLSIAGLIILAITRPTLTAWSKQQWIYIIRFGIAMGLMNTFFYAGIDKLPLGTAVTIEFIGPLTLAALLSKNLKDYLWVTLALLGIGLFGLEALTSTHSLDLHGVAFILAAAFFWALYILTSATVGAHVPGTGGLGIAMLIGALPTMPAALAHTPDFITTPTLFTTAIGTALFGSLIPYSLEFYALKILPSHTFGILMSLEPAAAATLGFLLLNQPISSHGTLAIACVMSASIGTTLSARARRKNPKPTSTASIRD